MRDLFTAHLVRKLLLSNSAQCFHLEFSVEGVAEFNFEPGQFVSCVAVDSRGKQQTRAYSLASSTRGTGFDFCVNRVDGGFFSNLLCDLEEGSAVKMHGPHGMFTLHQPLVDGVLIASDTGIAPMRAFTQWLFPEDAPSRSADRLFTLIHGADQAGNLYYRNEFERIAADHGNFIYLPVLPPDQQNWTGVRGSVDDQAATLLAKRLHAMPAEPPDVYAYICGLNAMVAPCREKLRTAGVSRKHVIFERYD